MIHLTSSTNLSFRPSFLPPSTKAVPVQVGGAVDRLSIHETSFLRAELLREPEVRAEVVARARALAADPAYPPLSVLRDVARQIAGSPDLSEDVA